MKQAACELGLHDVARLRWSRLDAEADRFVQIGARHHMGATRMSPDPKQGVVDTLGRVHGVGNLYLGGSSIFPTSGTANPTLTILARSHSGWAITSTTDWRWRHDLSRSRS